jgi:PKD repeat protein
VDDALLNGHPVIAGVYMKIGKTAPDHWVVITGKIEKNGIETYAINDPASAARTTLLDYEHKVYAIRIYSSPIEGKGNVLQIIGKSPIELYVTDPQGRSTGINPFNGSEVNEIPNSSYYYESIADEISNESSPDIKIFEAYNPLEGLYNISVVGTDAGNYSIDINSYDAFSNQTHKGNFSGSTTTGEIRSLEIKIDITLPASITNLSLQSAGTTWLNFTWLNPPDPDFSHVLLYLNGSFITSVYSPQNYYNFTGLEPDTLYELGTHTVDSSCNINQTWVNKTARTAPIDETPVVNFPGMTDPPTDPDSDSLYEDINGSGRKDFNDVVIFFNYLEWVASNEPISSFDFNGNGRIDFNDIVKLFEKL